MDGATACERAVKRSKRGAKRSKRAARRSMRAAGRYGWPQSGKIQADGVALRPAHNTIQAAPHEAACTGRRAPTTV